MNAKDTPTFSPEERIYPVEAIRPPGRSIGSILVDRGYLDAADVARIAQVQEEQGIRFGDAAILLGLLSEEQIRHALSRQFNYAYLQDSDDNSLSRELVVAYQPFGAQAEQFRALRAQIGQSWFDRDLGQQALAVVSAERNAGRSYVTANLAVSFAQLGERTLIIDADMRHPRQHEIFHLDNRLGLSMLLGARAEGDLVQPVSGFENLSVLTAGPTPPNPQELLNKPLLRLLLDSLAERFDIILIDSTAIEHGSDARLLARRAGAAVAVARRNQTRQGDFAEMAESFSRAGVAMLGSILNTPQTGSGNA